MMDLSLPVIKISHFDSVTLESINTKGKRRRLCRILHLFRAKAALWVRIRATNSKQDKL